MAGGKMLITDNEINARIQNNKEEIKTSGNDKGILSRWWNDDERVSAGELAMDAIKGDPKKAKEKWDKMSTTDKLLVGADLIWNAALLVSPGGLFVAGARGVVKAAAGIYGKKAITKIAKEVAKKEFQEVGTNKLKDIAVKAVKSKADDVVKKTAQSKDVAKTGLGKKINEKVNDVAEKVAKKSEEAIKKSDDIKKVDMKVTKTMKNQDKNQKIKDFVNIQPGKNLPAESNLIKRMVNQHIKDSKKGVFISGPIMASIMFRKEEAKYIDREANLKYFINKSKGISDEEMTKEKYGKNAILSRSSSEKANENLGIKNQKNIGEKIQDDMGKQFKKITVKNLNGNGGG